VAWEIFPVVESFSWIRLEAERAQDGASDGRDPPSLYDSLVVSGIFVLIASLARESVSSRISSSLSLSSSSTGVPNRFRY